MATAIDFAKYFIKKGLDTNHNTYDGNMKLQKLLFFADIISLAESGEVLFSDPICAFSNGCVVESVRLRYKTDYSALHAESLEFVPSFTEAESNIINLTIAMFGDASAKELSDLNHSFAFWKTALQRSVQPNGYKDKHQAEVTPSEMMTEIDKIRTVIDAFRGGQCETENQEIVNGVTFYYPDNLEMSDEVLEKLDRFSREADDEVYSVYLDGENLVIY